MIILHIHREFRNILEYTFPSISYSFGKTDPDETSGAVSPSNSPPPGGDFTWGYNVELAGDLSIHMVPSVRLGISILGGAVLDANVSDLVSYAVVHR